MKFGFVTCVRLGLSCMEAVYKAGAELELIVTLKDDLAAKKSGRVFLDGFAKENGIRIYKVDHVNDLIAVEQFRKLDWLFIVGWSQIASNEAVNAPRRGALGIHPTLLPQGRGRAAIPWAILKGLEKTGVTLFKLDSGVDTGPIVAQNEIPISPSTTATELYETVEKAHGSLIEHVMPSLLHDSVALRPQDESMATVWPGRKPEDGQINENGSVVEADRLVRAVTRPYPGAFFFSESGHKVVVWKARVSNKKPGGLSLEFHDGFLELLEYDSESSQIHRAK